MITRKFSLRRRQYFPLIFGVLLSISIFGYFQIVEGVTAAPLTTKNFTTLGTLVGGIVAFMYFFYKQHDQDTDVFLRLFAQLNLRYDALNGDLSEIAESEGEHPLTKKERDTLCDYYNLCAEQYMYFTAGYIDDRVWNAWTSGMLYYYQIPKIQRHWNKELAQESYYGFEPAIVFKGKLKK